MRSLFLTLWIVVSLAGCSTNPLGETHIQKKLPPEKFQVREVVGQQAATTEIFRYKKIDSYESHPETEVFLEKSVLFDGKSITDARIIGGQDFVYFGVRLEFTESGSVLWDDLAERYLTKTVALVADGKVLYTARIVGTRFKGGLTITGAWSKKDATAIAKTIQSFTENKGRPS